jgi:hypothetical protein
VSRAPPLRRPHDKPAIRSLLYPVVTRAAGAAAGAHRLGAGGRMGTRRTRGCWLVCLWRHLLTRPAVPTGSTPCCTDTQLKQRVMKVTPYNERRRAGVASRAQDLDPLGARLRADNHFRRAEQRPGAAARSPTVDLGGAWGVGDRLSGGRRPCGGGPGLDLAAAGDRAGVAPRTRGWAAAVCRVPGCRAAHAAGGARGKGPRAVGGGRWQTQTAEQKARAGRGLCNSKVLAVGQFRDATRCKAPARRGSWHAKDEAAAG